jgi:hypothetical protein
LHVQDNLPGNKVEGKNREEHHQGPEGHLTMRCWFLGEPVREGRLGCRARSPAAVGGTSQDHRLRLGTESNYHS